MDEDYLKNCSVTQLKKLGKELGIRGYSDWKATNRKKIHKTILEASKNKSVSQEEGGSCVIC